jgi:hypothetical protein
VPVLGAGPSGLTVTLVRLAVIAPCLAAVPLVAVPTIAAWCASTL